MIKILAGTLTLVKEVGKDNYSRASHLEFWQGASLISEWGGAGRQAKVISQKGGICPGCDSHTSLPALNVQLPELHNRHISH